MDSIDVQKEVLAEVEILGHKALFTELRVDKSTIPEGVFCYALRHGDDDSYPATLENGVSVNYFGSVLLTEEIELDEMKMRSVGYEDFGYTGEEMKLSDFMEQQKCIPFIKASELTAFIDSNDISMQMTEQEAEILLGYMDGHGCMIGHSDEKIMCMDVCVGEDEQTWKPYSLDDAINDACDCNYDMILQAQQELESTDKFDEYEQVNARLESLREDEKVLDVMFDRTKYGKEVEQLGKQLADDFVRDMQSKGGIDGAIERMTEAIKEGKDLLPAVSPALKKDKGAR
ncbi:MAG: hypothetical protein J6D08_18075 [Lachnospiraceae bacterium]|nr:hypothetical protein [Lachnospiraceae bacterium]